MAFHISNQSWNPQGFVFICKQICSKTAKGSGIVVIAYVLEEIQRHFVSLGKEISILLRVFMLLEDHQFSVPTTLALPVQLLLKMKGLTMRAFDIHLAKVIFMNLHIVSLYIKVSLTHVF
jgi:hypothetical protein